MRFHDLRHTAATLLLERGVELVVIKELLGHTHIGVTASCMPTSGSASSVRTSTPSATSSEAPRAPTIRQLQNPSADVAVNGEGPGRYIRPGPSPCQSERSVLCINNNDSARISCHESASPGVPKIQLPH
ncbi:tyrosine-type recombinase/integrase [Kitasatospora sp. NPDC008050]|uniref:tyrosine-type recombinase/integrase n=1 Tax=Kitasatospora sp. NPDC008050 TaxID=3364021 RepID=UPI0036E33AAD